MLSRLCSYENSYFPSTLKLWNELDQQVRTLPTISRFKSNIKTIPDKIPDYTNVGECKYNIYWRASDIEAVAKKSIFMVWISFQVLHVVVELLSKMQTTIFSNVPYILTKETIF